MHGALIGVFALEVRALASCVCVFDVGTTFDKTVGASIIWAATEFGKIKEARSDNSSFVIMRGCFDCLKRSDTKTIRAAIRREDESSSACCC